MDQGVDIEPGTSDGNGLPNEPAAEAVDMVKEGNYSFCEFQIVRLNTSTCNTSLHILLIFMLSYLFIKMVYFCLVGKSDAAGSDRKQRSVSSESSAKTNAYGLDQDDDVETAPNEPVAEVVNEGR